MSTIAGIRSGVQRALFHVEESLPPLSAQHKRLVAVLEAIRIERQIPAGSLQWLGRKRKDRRALGRAFIAKALGNPPPTKALSARLTVDRTLRQLCGWEQGRPVPGESCFSRAFAEFAALGLNDRVQAVLVEAHSQDALVCHVSRDSTEIEAREKPVPKQNAAPSRSGPGRPKQGDVRPPKPAKRLERQYLQTAAEALAELPTACDVGAKRDRKGRVHHWVGYKFHVDIGDGGLPLAALTTSASMHDSQAAIPLTKLTAARGVVSLYDLMDSAYDAEIIRQVSREQGHVPIIDANPRRGEARPMAADRARRYRQRSQSERFTSDLKDNHGGKMVRVRGQPKVHTHLMLGLLVIFAKALVGLSWSGRPARHQQSQEGK